MSPELQMIYFLVSLGNHLSAQYFDAWPSHDPGLIYFGNIAPQLYLLRWTRCDVFIHIISLTKLIRMVVIWNNFVRETSFMKIYQKCWVISCTGNFINENLYEVLFMKMMDQTGYPHFREWSFIHENENDGPDRTHFHELLTIHSPAYRQNSLSGY